MHLCGHSFGGIVALEMAHQLQAQGRRRGLFAIIDTPLGAGRRGFLRKAHDAVNNLPAWLWYDGLRSRPSVLMARVAGKSSEVWRGLRSGKATSDPDMRAYFGRRHVPEEVEIRVRARIDVVRQYVRRPLPGTVVLFRLRAQALMGRSDRSLGWDLLASHVEVHDVPGHHDSCTQPPHVRRLASILSLRLREKDSE